MDSVPLTSIRVLQLEENSDDAELNAIELRRAWPRCAIVTVGSLDAFRAALREQRFDVILSDFAVRGHTGFDALGVGCSLAPDVPFIVVSGSIGEEKAVELLKTGATDYVLKDRPARLISAIERAMGDASARRMQRAAEEKVRETEERFRALAESCGDVFWFADVDPVLRIRYISASVEPIWGLKARDFYVNPALWLGGVHADDRPRVERDFRAWFGGDVSRITGEFRIVHADGTIRWVHNIGISTGDAQGRGRRLSGIVHDITQTREAAEQAMRAQRLESIGLLAGGVAHDLNNALAPILMGLDLMQGSLPAELIPIFDSMQLSANRGAAMVRQLLGFARGAEGQKALVDVRRAVHEIEQLAHRTFPKLIAVEVRATAEPSSVEIDPTLLHQVVLNLCVNARDAMPAGGTLLIDVRRTEVDESYAGFIREARPGTYVVLAISDTGTGIAPEVLPRIFDPFFTTKPAGVGTGLGLTTVAGIAHNHGGFVQVQSEIGRGTTFRVFFPAAAADGPLPAGAAPQIFEGKGRGVLVVDDEEPVRVLLKQLLERLSFRVLVGADGAEGLALFAAQREQIDLVITDERMPHLDGINFLRALRHLAPGLPIIAMSGLHSESRVKEFLALGVGHFLHKPFALSELTAALVDCLAEAPRQQELGFQPTAAGG